MRITEVTAWKEAVPLSRPYTIATRTVSAVDLFYLRLVTDDGHQGLGSASPAPGVTGETQEACGQALGEGRIGWLVGEDPRHLGRCCRRLTEDLVETPAARAAVDMALYDLFGHVVGVPVVDLLGRRRAEPLATSITLGIMSTDNALEEAEEYLGRGFRCLKVKIGLDLEADVERLSRLREAVGPEVAIRVDGNQGYDFDQAARFAELADELDVELVEQPLPRSDTDSMRRLPDRLRRRVAADESLHGEADALDLVQRPEACGIFNIKLMKCGGITAARGIGSIAAAAGLELMWGCMDESVVSIAAALHAAYADPSTRYLDLDGSFDLARDLGEGGFVLEHGRLRLPEGPGLGVRLRPDRS